MLVLFDVIFIYFGILDIMIILYLKRLDRIALAAGQEPQFSGRIFQKTLIFTTYSTVPASGASRRDPPRHGDFGAQILVKKGLM